MRLSALRSELQREAQAIKKVILQATDPETVYAQAVAARRALESGPPDDGTGFRIYEVGASLFAVKFNRSSITVWPQEADLPPGPEAI